MRREGVAGCCVIATYFSVSVSGHSVATWFFRVPTKWRSDELALLSVISPSKNRVPFFWVVLGRASSCELFTVTSPEASWAGLRRAK